MAYVSVLALIGVVALVVFAPWHPPGFVSDSWYLMARYGEMPLAEQLARLIPNSGEVYRPLTNFGYWLTWQLFGLEPLGHFAVQVAAHAAAALLIGLLTFQLTRDRWAALAAGAAFLFVPQANEAVWDYSSLHRVLSAVAVPAAVLAYVRGRRWLALLFAALALLIDEAGVLVLALIGVYELLYGLYGTRQWRPALTSAVGRLLPIAALMGVYLLVRLAVGVYNYVQPCRSVACLAVGAAEYANRLVVRGDDLVAFLWTARPIVLVAVIAFALLALVLTAPWRWPDRRPFVLGVAWAGLGSAFYVLTLWGYVADRFVYVPAMGAALVIGAMVAGVRGSWTGSRSARLLAPALAGVVLVVWICAGAVTLADRGRRWVASAEHSRVLAAELNALVSSPAPGTQVLVYDVPRMQRPLFPPGNTGPYEYMNGMEWAMRLSYGWPADVALPRDPTTYQPPAGSIVLEFDVVNGHVVKLQR